MQLVAQACDAATPTSLEIVCSALAATAASLSIDGDGASVIPPASTTPLTHLALEYEISRGSSDAVRFGGLGEQAFCVAAPHSALGMQPLVPSLFFPWLCDWAPRCTLTMALQVLDGDAHGSSSAGHTHSVVLASSSGHIQTVVLASGVECPPCTCGETAPPRSGHTGYHNTPTPPAACVCCAPHPPGFFAPGVRRACFRVDTPVPVSAVGFVAGPLQRLHAAQAVVSGHGDSRVQLWHPLASIRPSSGPAPSPPRWALEASARAASAVLTHCERAAEFVHEWAHTPLSAAPSSLHQPTHRFVYLPESMLPCAASLAATPTALGNPGSPSLLLHAYPEQDVMSLAGGLTLLPVSYLHLQLLHPNTAHAGGPSESMVLDHAGTAHFMQVLGLARDVVGSPVAEQELSHKWLQVRGGGK
jgi:hypothetical protein